jgi:hypothetical protein
MHNTIKLSYRFCLKIYKKSVLGFILYVIEFWSWPLFLFAADLSGRRDLPGCKAGGQTEAQCYEIKQPDQTNLTNAKGDKSMVTVRFTLTNAEQEYFPHL